MNNLELKPPTFLSTFMACNTCLVMLACWGAVPFLASGAYWGQTQRPDLLGLVAVVCLVLPLLFMWLFQVEDRYCVEQGHLRFCRRFLGLRGSQDVVRLDQLTTLVEEPRNSNHCRFHVFTSDGRKLAIHDMPKEPYSEVKAFGARLGEALGVPFVASGEDVAGWASIRRGAESGQLILDPTTTPERILGGGGCLCLTVSLACLFVSPLFVVAALPGMFLLFLARHLDEYYLLDFGGGRFVFVRVFFGFESRREVCRLSDFEALVVESRLSRGKNTVDWYYGLTLLTQQRKYRVIDQSESSHQRTCREAAKLAELLDVEVKQGEPEQLTRILPGPGGFRVEFVAP
ncbi:MAG: hypothetical protein AB7S38_15415 [Vulcanimicrobiota bacterium]